MMNSKSYQLFKRLLRQVRPYWPHLTVLLFLNLVALPVTLLKPLPLKIMIDSGLGDLPLPSYLSFVTGSASGGRFLAIAWAVAIMVIGIALLENIQVFFSWVLHAYTGEKMVLDFKQTLFEHIQQLSIAYHDKKGSADALYRLQFDTPAIRTFLFSGLSPLMVALFSLGGMVFIIGSIHWPFAIIALSMMPLLYWVMRRASSHLQGQWDNVKQNESRAMAVVHEVMGALRVVKAFGREQGEGKRFLSKAGKAVEGQVKVAAIGAKYYFYTGLIMAAGSALFIYYGSIQVHSGAMSLGELTLVSAYLVQLFSPMEKISKILNEMPASLSSMERVYTLLDLNKEVPEAKVPLTIQRASGRIRFTNVTFSYNRNNTILDQVSFDLLPGQRLGIIGTTGSGKSTLMNLLMRFYDPDHGCVELDGTDCRRYKLSDYRKQFSMVWQEPVLFSTSLAENISYGNPDASREQIEQAARLANAHAFISSLPHGYETEVGERGMQLSGGERQRISIARAFLKDAPVLILDEPTSALDIGTEQQIMEAMERLMQGRTTLLITHRFDILGTCDKVIRMERGRITESVPLPDARYLALTKNKLLNQPYP